MRILAVAAVISGVLGGVPAWALTTVQVPPLLAEMFQDHAVLQRDRPLTIWGQSKAGETVKLTLNGRTINAVAGTDGRWQADYPANPAGGPYTLEVATASGARKSVKDIMFGDVFLCSGQSNMQWNVQGTIGSQGAIATSKDDHIRMMTVSQTQSLTPSATFIKPVNWQVASPETVPNWSAVCYYYARELKLNLNVPIGLINASWGGSNIRPWMSETALRKLGYDEPVDLMKLYSSDAPAAAVRWGLEFETWWAKNGGNGRPWAITPKALSGWDKVPDVTKNWEQWGVADLAAYDGGLWYATAVKITAAQARGEATLTLGPIDEIDQTWLTGKAVGYTSGPGTPRVYKLPAGTLKAGDNTIVINAVDTWGAGGLYGDTQRNLTFADGTSVSIAANWRFQRVPVSTARPPRAPWDATGGLMTLYNAMIAPIGPYGLKGALWYQGESNTGEVVSYADHLSGMMADWRGQFGPDLPFLVVQLANYGARPTTPVESGWARLREEQRLAVLKDGNAALAVTIDIGDPNDIHPLDKTTVGKRLARGARAVIYKEKLTPSGPQVQSATRTGAHTDDSVTVTFTDIEGQLISYSSDKPISFELCDTARGPCTYAAAQLTGNTVTLKASNAASAQYVRYCWADSPTCTLYDRSGLPAGPFEIAIKQNAGK